MSTGGKGGAVPQQAATNPFMAASQGMQGAYNSVGGAMAQNANNRYSPVTASVQQNAPTLAGSMSRYMNPYEDQVVQGMTQDANRQLGQMQTQNAADADAAGAFGGSRHGLVEAETNIGVNRNLQDSVGQLRHQGFTTAGQMAGQDVANTLGVRQANQAARNNTNQFNATMRMQDRQNRFGNAMQGASQLGNLAQAGFGMGSSINQQQSQQGSLAQQLSQQLLNQGQGMYGQFVGQPQQLLNMRLAALGVNPLNNATSTTQTAQQPNTLGGNLLSALGSMFSFAPIALPFSSRRYKDEIEETGGFYVTPLGDKVKEVTFKYKWDKSTVHTGIIAEDLRDNDPALIKSDGIPHAVRYELLKKVGA